MTDNVSPLVRPSTAPRARSRTDDARREPRRQEDPLWRHVLGDHLRSLRHERGETLTQTADRAGVSPQYLSEIERGTKEPSSEMIAAVAGALDATLVDLTLGVAANLQSAADVRSGGAVCRASYSLAA